MKRIVLALSFALMGIAVWVLWSKLSVLDWAKVGQAMGAVGTPTLILAGLATVAAYMTLTCYDYFATRTIGRSDVSYGTCATASFTSYTIAHNLGATVFTAAVVRYLIYSRHGFSAPEVIKVCVIAGLTFWLGNAAVLGLGFLLEPEVVTPVVEQIGINGNMVRMVGAAVLLALFGWLLFVSKPRSICTGAWAIQLPTTRLTALQLVIGVIDLACTSFIFYVILNAMPHASPVGYQAVAVVFVSAMLLGFASHAPGAAGAFEATLLVALPPLGFEAEYVVAAFIMFRLYYFVAPFILALCMVAIRELVSGGGSFSNLKNSMAVIQNAEAQRQSAKIVDRQPAA